MRLNIRLKSYKAAVSRLEAVVGKGMNNCVSCLLTLCHYWPDPEEVNSKASKLQSEDIFWAKCEFCHAEYGLSLTGFPEEGRKIIRLEHSFTLEDEYINPKAHAFKLWQEFWPENKRGRSAGNQQSINNKRARTRSQLQKKFDELVERKHRRLKAKYGALPFPEHKQLIESVEESQRQRRNAFISDLNRLVQEETDYLICAELEKLIWGNTRPATVASIELIGRKIEELKEEADARRKENGRQQYQAQSELSPR